MWLRAGPKTSEPPNRTGPALLLLPASQAPRSLRRHPNQGQLPVTRNLDEAVLLLAHALRNRPLELPLEDQVDDQYRYDGDDHGREECSEVHRVAGLGRE